MHAASHSTAGVTVRPSSSIVAASGACFRFVPDRNESWSAFAFRLADHIIRDLVRLRFDALIFPNDSKLFFASFGIPANYGSLETRSDSNPAGPLIKKSDQPVLLLANVQSSKVNCH